jgi:FkbM family methyltransferase
VLSFEPSPRECGRLKNNLLWNWCSNVELLPCALGEEPGETDLFLADGSQDWCNSLRPPLVDGPTRAVRVSVRRLDTVLVERKISKVDFIKLDVEGAELPVLYGAVRLLQRESRPAILAEVQDIRTLAWGYPAREIVEFLMRMDYRWFAIAANGALLPVSCDQQTYDANLVALPAERAEEFLSLLGQRSGE